MSVTALDASSLLPAYTPPAVVPSYLPEPGNGERLIERAPHSKSRRATGNYIKKCGRDTVVLTDQDATAEMPTYGRQAHINGFVSMDKRELVLKVVLTVKGKIEVAISEGESVSKTVVDEHCTLWPSQNHGGSMCPSTVPFSTMLPAKFEDGKGSYPLPPSYQAAFIASGGYNVKVIYTLSIAVVRTRKLNFMSTKNTTSVPFNYVPRTRPSRAIQPFVSGFFADIKLMPEEWRQTTALVSPRPKSTLPPVHIHLFIPAAEIFALGDTVPFHVQLTGAVASLRAFLPDPSHKGPEIQVSLLRQLIAGQTSSVRFAAAHATLASAPPGVHAPDSDEHASLDWAGELHCGPVIQVGSFDAGVLKMQDFIVVDIFPAAGTKSEFARVRHSHPIRIVTDSWPDT
ncbi:hypothetical protein B0H17DRAFT_1337289 [Mycena rosella]|uniref:Uncharacterized protein n=1 Tax=Mycena rosella TaxID=1033263 RepID=A0AAD7CSF1_MYCRO|nr:hypothetical protein B0H17DRAFT_1337289 [Mycena rosella]